MAAANGSGAATAEDRRLDQLIAAYRDKPTPLVLNCGLQHYGWGDRHFIPALLGLDAPAPRPWAELWIGAHPDLPATASLGAGPQVPLNQLIAGAPRAVLGRATVAHFGDELPFLFKVLAAGKPLSLQVHPDRAEAERGFALEERLGIRTSDPRRNYRDRNHKPELLVALSDFHALRGFRPLREIAAELAHYPPLDDLAGMLDGTGEGLRRLYAHFMRLSQADVDALLEPVLSISRPRADDENDPGQARCRWLLHADDLFSSAGHHDRGLLSFLLLNLLHLRPGQAIFLPAGQLHSYLAGAGLELMANSNNVLRGGLTSKHIDVDALLDVLHVDPRAPEILEPETLASNPDFGAPAGATPMRYDTPSAEFALERLRLPPHARHVLTPRSVVLGLVLGGTVEITGAAAGLRVGRGGCFLLPAGCTANMRATSGADVALATVPCMAGCADGD